MNRKLSEAIKRRSGGRCEARVVCRGARAIHMHHRQRAGRIDSEGILLHVCEKDHLWIHANPHKAYLAGLLVHSWDDPAHIVVDRNYIDTLSPADRSLTSTPPGVDRCTSQVPVGGDLAIEVLS